MKRFGTLFGLVGALVVGLGVSGPAYAAELGYTDGTQCQGPFCPGAPPPTDPVWAQGQACKIDIVDPPSFVYVTEHFVYATTPPPAGVVPVVADASAVFQYHGEAPGLFAVDVEAYVAGKRGFRANTWNIGVGVTRWVPFDCAVPETTTIETTTTTSASIEGATTTTAPTTTPIGNLGTTTTSIDDSTTTSIENLGTTTTDASASTGSLPFTGGGSGLVPVALITLGAGLAFVFSAKRRRLSRD
jgi:hypothetical protein